MNSILLRSCPYNLSYTLVSDSAYAVIYIPSLWGGVAHGGVGSACIHCLHSQDIAGVYSLQFTVLNKQPTDTNTPQYKRESAYTGGQRNRRDSWAEYGGRGGSVAPRPRAALPSPVPRPARVQGKAYFEFKFEFRVPSYNKQPYTNKWRMLSAPRRLEQHTAVSH